MNFLFELQMLAALCLDLLFGDPRWFPHPVRFIGLLCSRFETLFRRLLSSSAALAGTVTVVGVLGVTVTVTTVILAAAALFSPLFSQGVAICILYLAVAARDLTAHSKRVYLALEDSSSLEKARASVACIVGRDTAALDRPGIIRACVETVAENMVDGVTAPIFYAILFSLLAPASGIDPILLAALGAICYKSINTMDSMFGYKNERYVLFGRSAARLDDIVNCIPARISSLFLVVAAFFLRLDWKKSYTIFRRDRLNHASPNAGHPEAAVAGALGVQLGGVSEYFGEAVHKPVIGSAVREIEARDILRTNSLMLLASFVFLIFMLIVRESLLHIFT